jgi:hypothetical protein
MDPTKIAAKVQSLPVSPNSKPQLGQRSDSESHAEQRKAPHEIHPMNFIGIKDFPVFRTDQHCRHNHHDGHKHGFDEERPNGIRPFYAGFNDTVARGPFTVKRVIQLFRPDLRMLIAEIVSRGAHSRRNVFFSSFFIRSRTAQE